MKKIINTELAPAAVGPYVQAVIVNNMLYASGQLGLTPEDGMLPEGIEKQTKQSLKNVEAILQSVNLSKEDVVKTTVYITDMGNFASVNAIYEAFFGTHKPARSCVEVSKLPKDGLVEIEVIASK